VNLEQVEDNIKISIIKEELKKWSKMEKNSLNYISKEEE
jgi:hypothetical protein